MCPILVINLDASRARMAAADQKLQACGQGYERLEAVNGCALPAEELAGVVSADRADFFKLLSAGEAGCYLSHLRALERMVREGWPRMVVLEDDFQLKPDFLPAIEALLAVPGEPPHLIKLEGALSGGDVVTRLATGHKVVRYRRPPIHATALLWSLEGARRFLAQSSKLRRPVDVQMKHWWEGDLDVLAITPAIVGLDPELSKESTIGARRPVGFSGLIRRLGYRVSYSLASHWHCLRKFGFGGWRRATFG